MARLALTVVGGLPHHVTQRGNLKNHVWEIRGHEFRLNSVLGVE
jgi:hypothetical protein